VRCVFLKTCAWRSASQRALTRKRERAGLTTKARFKGKALPTRAKELDGVADVICQQKASSGGDQ
jgi:hypothetical protein